MISGDRDRVRHENKSTAARERSMRKANRRDYGGITERPGMAATSEQLRRLCQRYGFAAQRGRSKRVLEIGCGAGTGLGCVAEAATWLAGGDYSYENLKLGHATFRGRVPLLCLDAHSLPFRDGVFDFVFMFEGLYYLDQPDRFLSECGRVLSSHGELLIGTVNCDWADFAASPLSTRYFSLPELCDSVENAGFEKVECYAGFPATPVLTRDRLTSAVRRFAIACGLMPRTLAGRAWLKRIFYGPTSHIPTELVLPPSPFEKPVSVPRLPTPDYKILYVSARRT